MLICEIRFKYQFQPFNNIKQQLCNYYLSAICKLLTFAQVLILIIKNKEL